MTQNPWVTFKRRDLTEAEVREHAAELERLLVALAVHGPSVLELAYHADFLQGKLNRGTLVAYNRKVNEARQYLRDTGKPYVVRRSVIPKRAAK